MSELSPIEAIVVAASKLPPEARAGYLDDALSAEGPLRQQAGRLLRAYLALDDASQAPSGASKPPAVESVEPVPSDVTMALPPSAIASGALVAGRYKLIEPIGEGGMGTVWMARQLEPMKRLVALKLIKPGMDSRQVLARFAAERQALSLMDHPNIARVFDGGTTEDGRPYFVMELVRGIPLIEYCDAREMPVRQRLELFIQVCSAVGHAHQKGIIHRDLKPTNVLVTEHDGQPVPKVIDFGLAKALGELQLSEQSLYTAFGTIVGTPLYMAPEQVAINALDIDTRSDVYSLGVLLYELLTGVTPIEKQRLKEAVWDEVRRIIREEDAIRPSTRLSSSDTLPRVAALRHTDPKHLLESVRGDLDWIVLKALEKDRNRRYETVQGLAMDINRHLSDEPVLACPPSVSYRIKKFVRRNRRMVVAASLVAVALLLGIVGTSVGMVLVERERRLVVYERDQKEEALVAEANQRQRAEENQRRAEWEAQRAGQAEADALRRADELERVSQFQAEQLAQIDAPLMGLSLRSELLDRARTAADRAGHEPPTIDDRLRDFQQYLEGLDWTGLALTTLDANVFSRAIEAIERQFEDQPLLRARLLQTIAITRRELGLLEQAVEPQSEALSLRRDLLGLLHEDALMSLEETGALLLAQGKREEAEAVFRETLQGRREVLGADHPHTLHSSGSLALTLHARGKYAEGEALLRETLDARRRTLGDDHPDTFNSINNLALSLKDRAKFAEAEQLYREALDVSRRLYGEEHRSTLKVKHNIALLLEAQGNLAEAERYNREVLALRRQLLGDQHPETIGTLSNLGGLLVRVGRMDEADAMLHEALEISRRTLGNDHDLTLHTINSIGMMLEAAGRLDESEIYFREGLEICRRVRGSDHADTIAAINNMGAVLHRLGRNEEAQEFLEEGMESSRRVFGNDHPTTMMCIGNLASILRSQGRLSEAEPLAREAMETSRRVLGDRHPSTVLFVHNMGVLLRFQGKFAEAEPLQREALQMSQATFGDDHPMTFTALFSLAAVLVGQEHLEQAEPLLRQCVEGRLRVLGEEHLDSITANHDLGYVLLKLQEFDEAGVYLRRALEGRRKHLPAGHPAIVLSMITLVDLLRQTEQYEESLELVQQAIAAARQITPPQNSNLAPALALYGQILGATGRFAEAVESLSEAYEVFASIDGTSDNTSAAADSLADVYDQWHAIEPDTGHDKRAAQWRAASLQGKR